MEALEGSRLLTDMLYKVLHLQINSEYKNEKKRATFVGSQERKVFILIIMAFIFHPQVQCLLLVFDKHINFIYFSFVPILLRVSV